MLSDEHGLNISQRNITASTCGIVPNMRRLAEEGLQITLALSLHGSSQEKRKKLMPVANKYDLSEVLDACDYYFDKTGRRITFEYSLVAGVNDQPDDIREPVSYTHLDVYKRQVLRNISRNLDKINYPDEKDKVSYLSVKYSLPEWRVKQGLNGYDDCLLYTSRCV